MNRYNDIIIYHWGHAEKTYIENIHKRFPDIQLPNMKLIDLCAGTGAFSKSFLEFGVDCVYANDLCKSSKEIYSTPEFIPIF